MHIPSKFIQNEHSQLKAIIREYPFATLVTYSDSGVEATHLPVILDQSNGKDSLKGHIAKTNTLWESVAENSEVLLIFNGPNCYISPNYYPTKHETGKAVPTWNYVVVHVKGKISFIHDSRRIYNIVDSLTNEHESKHNNPWSILDAPETYISNMLSAIVGIEISINSIVGQWKLSQNQPEVNRFGVIQGLLKNEEALDLKVAELVKNQLGID